MPHDDAFDFDTRFARDNEREPTRLRTPRRSIELSPHGTLRTAFVRDAMARHGAECTCQYCAEQPLTDATLDVLRKGGVL